MDEQSEFVRERAEWAKEEARDQRQRLRGNGKDTSGQRRRFELARFDEIKLGKRRRYLVKNLIPREGLIVVWGPPKCGKSFWVSDLALHVALGWEYRGRPVEAGAVVYIACEGQEGYRARIEAFRTANPAVSIGDPPPFHLLPTRLDLAGDIDALIADISMQLGEAGCVLVVIDTLNRSLVGSESKDEDMTGYIAACDKLREAFGCAVIIVHHCGVEGTRPRGHTSLTGAADAQIAVRRDTADQIVAKVEYMKDGPEGDQIVSRLTVVDAGNDEDGESVTSCVIEVGDEAPQNRRRPVGGQAGIAFRMLQNAVAEGGQKPPDNSHFPSNRLVVPLALWRTFCEKGGLTAGDSEDAFKKAFNRARDRLLSDRYIGIWDDRVLDC